MIKQKVDQLLTDFEAPLELPQSIVGCLARRTHAPDRLLPSHRPEIMKINYKNTLNNNNKSI